MDRYVIKNGKRLRYGYTTGSCATAASKAAAMMLLEGKAIEKVKIDTPKGWELDLKVHDISIDATGASCSIIKDGGDDPDATNGLKIYSQVSWRNDGEIHIDGGIGVGRITKGGLPVPVGSAAINPVPRQMIEREVRSVIGEGRGVDIKIYVPRGEEVGAKTFNPRLGIVGGISILGTSGIVEPMSEEAFKESLSIELSMLRNEGVEKLVMVPGNYGRDLARDHFRIDEKHLFKISNFVGFMLDEALAKGIKKILIIGHMGKIVKVAGGIFHTHSKIADGRLEILTAYLGLMGASREDLKKIMESNTTEEAIQSIKEFGYDDVFLTLAEKISEKCRQRTYHKVEIGTVVFSMEEGVLGVCPIGEELLEEFKNE
ncbi:cobalt-precorrin-5B (C(1))-methyltransferase CbiD [Alkaliphilus hydrothermalis]|uniref:Cobalt-precorrin-5B C(1)-methyltransferase n=1 Tax=Alkaliphilus hydrothermalis TaxID=1482730 RepID=A0ABS2NP54_9FIRM|nr:cobalt-precorrin-5B (C(1))-methyltransferase CbiD [Alkaliphilus hydrothermalis]MBM7614723.1 cobalt-precorrin-5B (C1)-methyltransferase [Alkaliphilus hydrothermalis]